MHSTAPIVSLQRGVFKYSKPTGPGTRKGGGVRGKCVEFTPGARRRMMAYIATVDVDFYQEHKTPFLMLTLSIPVSLNLSHLQAYQALRKWRRWMKALPGYEGALWKKEYGDDNVNLHYHLITVGIARIPVDEARAVWEKAVGWDAVANGAHIQLRVEKSYSPQRSMNYLSKYVSKEVHGAEGAGAGGVASSAREERDAGPADPMCLSLTKAHIGTEKEPEHTGSKWWGVWGSLRICEKVIVPTDNPKVLAMKVRRVYRRHSVQERHRAYVKGCAKQGDTGELLLKHEDSAIKRSLARKVKRNAPRDDNGKRVRSRDPLGWLKRGGGFSVFMEPKLAQLCIAAARADITCSMGVELSFSSSRAGADDVVPLSDCDDVATHFGRHSVVAAVMAQKVREGKPCPIARGIAVRQ